MEALQLIFDAVQGFGMWAVFAILFYQERQRHRECQQAHMEDLRDIAGLRSQLRPTATPTD